MDNKKILIVEDEVVLAEVLRDLLVSREYSVDIVREGRAGLENIEEHKPDAILLDILMPGMDGIEMLKKLQKPETKDIPVIIITNLPGKEKAVREVSEDAHYLFKAEVSLKDVADEVDKLFNGS
jgi:CheY-like chemotaxis protein